MSRAYKMGCHFNHGQLIEALLSGSWTLKDSSMKTERHIGNYKHVNRSVSRGGSCVIEACTATLN